LFTIGFGQKSARQFFTLLQENKVKRVIDIRLNNSSQLAGYTKKSDLGFFLQAIAGIGYIHVEDFAPTKEIMDEYKSKKTNWQTYEKQYTELIAARNPLGKLDLNIFDGACLLCSEPTAEQCHRRLLAEYLTTVIPDLRIVHL